MKPLNAQKVAQSFLRAHQTGPTYRGFLKENIKGYLQLFCFTAAFCAIMLLLDDTYSAGLLIAMLAGMLLRDGDRYRTALHQWPFTEKVIDWEKVEKVANGVADELL